MKKYLLTTFMAALIVPSLGHAQTEGPPSGIVHAFDMRTRENFIKFPANDPSAIEFVNKNRRPLAMDFDFAGEILWAVDGNTMEYGKLNPLTGLFASLGSLTGDLTGVPAGLSLDPALDVFYLCTATDLYQLDVNTGNTVFVASFFSGPSFGEIAEIAIDLSGQMYAIGIDPNLDDATIEGGLWSVNKANGFANRLSNPVFPATGPQGMDFDYFTNTLYVSLNGAAGSGGTYGIWSHTSFNYFQIATTDAISGNDPRFKISIANNLTHAYDVRSIPNSMTRFIPDAPIPVDSSSDIAYYDTHAVDFAADRTTLYMHDNLTDMWGTVDSDSGCFTAIAPRSGDLMIDPSGLSNDPTTDTFYCVAGGALGSELFVVDVGTGDSMIQASIVDDNGEPLDFIVDIAFNSVGELFAFDIATNTLYEVDISSGEATPIGDSGLPANFAQGMDFDPLTDTLYQAVYFGSGLGSYGSWNLRTGTFTEILPMEAFFDPVGGGYELEIAIGIDFILGDVNGDGEVNLLDVGPFVDAISNGVYIPAADINMDGQVNLLDVALFIMLLSG